MTTHELEHYILHRYQGVIATDAYRERSFFYNPGQLLVKGVYFATIKESDGPNDTASQLDRTGVYRLSIGIGKKHYQERFGMPPDRPEKGGIVKTGHDFSMLNELLPHPVYAWMGWVCINNPPADQLPMLFGLMDIAFNTAIAKFDRRRKQVRSRPGAK